jgi:cytoskeleton protein RodZ
MISGLGRIEFYLPPARDTRRIGLPSFGEKLKLEREKRKITLEEVSVSTKIGTRMLQALEENDFDQLPGGIFNRGFVRAYSRVLGLDEEQTVADYLQASGDVPSTRAHAASVEIAAQDGGSHYDLPTEAESGNEDDHPGIAAASEASKRQIPWGLLAGLLLVVALTLSLWSRYDRHQSRRSIAADSATTSVSSASHRSTSKERSAPSIAAAPELSGHTLSGQTLSGHTLDVSADSPPKLESATRGAIVANVSESTESAAGDFSVAIQAREESWVTITADGKPILSELMGAGSQHRIHGHKEIIVKAGNAGGLDFQFNGQKLPAVGDYGEVKIVTFGPGGIIL